MRAGTAVLVSRRDAISTVSVPNVSIAAATAEGGSYTAEVVTSSWAISDCSCASVAPYSALSKPPNCTRPSCTVISPQHRSPCEIWL